MPHINDVEDEDDEDLNGTNTSDDSISDLESESEDELSGKKHSDQVPLTSEEARLLRREWIKRRINLGARNDELSQYENINRDGGHR